jgi:DNA-binding MarR family transcriptional regulator
MVVADALSRSGITRLLDRMERDGLITRTVSTTDRRRFDVSLTPAGRRRFDQVWPGHAEGIGRYFVQPLPPGDIAELARILDGLIRAN